jgi:hypothetical protein
MPDQPLTPQEIEEALEDLGYSSGWSNDEYGRFARTLLPRALRALQQRAEDTERLRLANDVLEQSEIFEESYTHEEVTALNHAATVAYFFCRGRPTDKGKSLADECEATVRVAIDARAKEAERG